jgi:hypothetical protein
VNIIFLNEFQTTIIAIIFLCHSLQSVVSEGKSNALDVSFVRAPTATDLDWQLTAKISPCHVTVCIYPYLYSFKFMS